MVLYDYLSLAAGLLLIVQIVILVDAQNTNFSFPYFGIQDQASFLTVDDGQYYEANSSFLLSSRGASLFTPSCGRLLYKDKVRMKDSASGTVASFHTSFTFQITGPNYWYDAYGFEHGDGMSFTFTRNSTFLDETAGGALCLLKETNNGQASNRVFAVEFDTHLNPEYLDPSDSHIAIDINSVASAWSYNLCGGTKVNCSYLCNGGYFTSWIDYDSASQKLSVYLANGSSLANVQKPPQPLLNASLALAAAPLADLVDDFMYVGFSASTGSLSEVHQIQSWTFTSSGMPPLAAGQPPSGPPSPSSAVPTINTSSSSLTGTKVGIIAGVSGGVVAAAVIVILGFFIARYRKSTSAHQKENKFNLMDQNLVPRMFTYKELSKATHNFDRTELLGSGGFGAVFKGTLPSGALVAVKRIRHEAKHGEESFQAEAASLSQIRHRNLVQLRGWSNEEDQLFLVYDYMCNGSLDEWLYHFSTRNGAQGSLILNGYEALPLNLRHSILSGVAAALSYLHEECVQCVLHRDIKSSNVLLDGDLNAHLGDFGLARLIDHRKMEKTTLMAGTFGYMAPEMPRTGKATKESDIYSFGVLILEVMCGTQPTDKAAIERGDGVLVDRVWRAHEAGDILQLADSKLVTFPLWDSRFGSYGERLSQQVSSRIPSQARDSATEDKKLVTNLLHLGLLCCLPDPEQRPGMRLVSQLLQSSENMEMSMPAVPAYKPHSRYSTPGLSPVYMRPPSDSPSSRSEINVQDVSHGSFRSTAPSSGVSAGEPNNMLQTSFVASSEIFSGR